MIDIQFDVILEIEDKYLKILDFTYGSTWVYVLGLEKMDKATMEKLKQFYEDWKWKKERLRYFSSSYFKENLLDEACDMLNLNKSDFSVAYALLIICA